MSLDTRITQDGGQAITQETTTPPTMLTVTQIIEDLEEGRDRKAIKAKYGLTLDEVKMIFEHPKLKGMRVKKARVVRFTLVDDTIDETQTTLGDVIEQIAVETTEKISNNVTPSWDNVSDNQDEIND